MTDLGIIIFSSFLGGIIGFLFRELVVWRLLHRNEELNSLEVLMKDLYGPLLGVFNSLDLRERRQVKKANQSLTLLRNEYITIVSVYYRFQHNLTDSLGSLISGFIPLIEENPDGYFIDSKLNDEIRIADIEKELRAELKTITSERDRLYEARKGILRTLKFIILGKY